MEYLVWLFLASVIPLLLLWLRYWKLLWKYRATIIFVTVLMFIIHVPWDIAAVSSGLWYFPEGKNLGFFIVNLPLEEYLYTILIPMLGISITIVLKNIVKKTEI